MKLIIAGSRTVAPNPYQIQAIINDLDIHVEAVINGCAQGADTAGAEWGIRNDIKVIDCPARWKMFGKSAGFIRNEGMSNIGDALLAFWDGKSKGTRHMIDCAVDKNLPIWVAIPDGLEGFVVETFHAPQGALL